MERNRNSATEITIPASLSVRPSLQLASWQRSAEPADQSKRTVVVLLDGTAAAEQALPYALSIARRSGAAIRLVSVYSHLNDIEPWQFSQAAVGIQPSRRRKQEYLSKIAQVVVRREGLPIETVLIDSRQTIDAIASGAVGADLIVIGSRRRRLASRFWWLNTVDKLRRRLAIPMLLTAGQAAPIRVQPQFKNILVPLDGSVLSQQVLPKAKELARWGGGSLTLLNVQDAQWSTGFFEHTDPRGYLLSQVRQLQQNGTRAEPQILRTSLAAGRAIAAYVDAHVVDLIAIATRGDFGLSRTLRGSVADYLLRSTRIPILLQNVPGAVGVIRSL